MFLINHSLSSENKTIGYNYLIRKNKTKNKTKKNAIFYRELRQLFSFSLEIKRVSIRQTRNSYFKANYGWQRWVLLSFGVLRWVAPSFGVLRWVPPSLGIQTFCDVTSCENRSDDDEHNFRKNVPKYAQKLEKPYQYINISKLKVLSFQSPMPDLFKTGIKGLCEDPSVDWLKRFTCWLLCCSGHSSGVRFSQSILRIWVFAL